MKEQTIYIADDGTQFTDKSDCELWEQMLPHIRLVRQALEDDEEVPGAQVKKSD